MQRERDVETENRGEWGRGASVAPPPLIKIYLPDIDIQYLSHIFNCIQILFLSPITGGDKTTKPLPIHTI